MRLWRPLTIGPTNTARPASEAGFFVPKERYRAMGCPLKVGDTVLVLAKITELYDTEEYCNVGLESVLGRRPDGAVESIGAINTGVLVLANTVHDALDLKEPL